MNQIVQFLTSTSSASDIPLSNDISANTGRFRFNMELAAELAVTAEAAAKDQNKVVRAVYAYLRAVRALGRTTIDTAEIATALNLHLPDVDAAVAALREKGVKVAL